MPANKAAQRIGLTRVYLVPAERVQEFHDLVRTARIASQEDERTALWEAVDHMEDALTRSAIVKVSNEITKETTK